VPALLAGEVAVIEVAEMTVKLVAAAAPKYPDGFGHHPAHHSHADRLAQLEGSLISTHPRTV